MKQDKITVSFFYTTGKENVVAIIQACKHFSVRHVKKQKLQYIDNPMSSLSPIAIVVKPDSAIKVNISHLRIY